MLTIARLFIALMTARVDEFKTHTSRKVAYSSALGFFGLLVLIFGLSAATVALTQRFGVLYALLIMTGLAFLGCLVMLILMKIAERRHRVVAMEQDELRGRLQQLAVMSVIGGTTGGKPGIGKMIGLGVVGLATLHAVNSARKHRGE